MWNLGWRKNEQKETEKTVKWLVIASDLIKVINDMDIYYLFVVQN